MRYLCLLLCISYSGLMAQTTEVPSGYFTMKFLNMFFLMRKTMAYLNLFHESPDEKRIINDEGKVIDVYGGLHILM